MGNQNNNNSKTSYIFNRKQNVIEKWLDIMRNFCPYCEIADLNFALTNFWPILETGLIGHMLETSVAPLHTLIRASRAVSPLVSSVAGAIFLATRAWKCLNLVVKVWTYRNLVAISSRAVSTLVEKVMKVFCLLSSRNSKIWFRKSEHSKYQSRKFNRAISGSVAKVANVFFSS